MSPFGNPFDPATQQETVSFSNDDVVRLLTAGSKQNPDFLPQIDFDAGAKRVNQGTGEHGVVAYRDSKGTMNLTNVAIDAEGKTKKIGEGSEAVSPDTQASTAPANAGLKGSVFDPARVTGGAMDGMEGGKDPYIQKPDTPMPIFQALAKLRATTDFATARGIFDSLQQTTASEQARMEKEALQFAEAKVGLPTLERELMMARQADQKDIKYVPGMGDSPITNRILTNIEQARRLAMTEANNFLKSNPSYTSLSIATKSAEREYNRIAQFSQTKDLRDAQREAGAEASSAEFNRRREYDIETAFEGIGGRQLARIQALDLGKFVNLDKNSMEFKKAIVGMAKNKDPQYQKAINAEGTSALFDESFKGNKYARSLLIAEEAAATKRPVEEVENELKLYEEAFATDKMAKDIIQRNNPDPRMAKEKLTAYELLKKEVDPNKKLEASNSRIQLMRQWAQAKTMDTFVGKLDTWKVSDPLFLAAVDKARAVTNTTSLDNVLTAYMKDVDPADRKRKLDEFKNIMNNAANVRKNSSFAVIDTTELNARITQWARKEGIFAAMLNRKIDAAGTMLAGPMSAFPTAMQLFSQALISGERPRVNPGSPLESFVGE
jgi:hypothetical protein